MLPDGSMKPRALYLLLLPLLPFPLLLLFTSLFQLHHSFLPDCPHALLITQARHGSTWLLDSIEHCRYSHVEQVEPGIYGKRVYVDTELWHIHDSPLHNMTVSNVLSYLSNNSVKLFPTAFEDTPRVERLLTTADSPVIVLRRTPRDACCSRWKALRSGQWANVKGQVERDDGLCECDRECTEACRAWIRESEKFFADAARLLQRSSVQADWVWYEQIKDLPVITLRNAKCRIRNCNFADS